MRLTVAAAVTCLIAGVSIADDARAALKRAINIPAEDLGEALQSLAQDRGVQVVYFSAAVDSLKTQGAVGNFTTDEALTKVLSGTGLTYRYLGERTVTVVPVSTSDKSASSGSEGGSARSVEVGAGESAPLWERFRLAQVDQGPPAGAALSGASSSSDEPVRLEEIVVTAEKREERIQDVPVSVSVLSGATLTENNQLSLHDYYSSVPGFSIQTLAGSQTYLSIRGIAPGSSGLPTVGIVLDDVPFTSSTGNGVALPDFDPGDLDRIEVLRGPQGTLYGASSMGGLIKYVTTDPSTNGYSGRIEAGTSAVRNGAEPGYNIRASANIPLGTTLAIRVSGFDRQDPGYIDNPFYFRTGVNETETVGGRISALWHMTDDISLKLSALYQDTDAMGVSEIDEVPGLGDLQQNYLPGTGRSLYIVRSYDALLKAKFGNIDLTAVSAYRQNRIRDSFDDSVNLGSYSQQAFHNPQDSGVPDLYDDTFDKISEELRLSIPIGQRLTWLIGGFFTHDNDRAGSPLYGANGTTGEIVGTLLGQETSTTYTEYAGFTNLTYTINDRFDVQIGGRESSLKISAEPQINSGPVIPLVFQQPSPYIVPGGEATFHSFTYLVTPRFRLSPDVMVYVRAASGYRPGGYNGFGGIFPPTYNPDRTQDFDLGLKGDFLGGKVSIDTALYYIRWTDMQTPVVGMFPGGLEATYTANAGQAKSDGIEISMTSTPLTGLTVSGWFDYDDAVITSLPANASLYAPVGTRLPQAMRLSGNLSVEQSFPLWDRAHGFLGGTLGWTGNREGLLQGSAAAGRQYFPGYAKLDVRGGVKNDSWTVNLYANNVTDKRGIIGGGLDEGNSAPYAFAIITPRTIGVSVIKTFGSP